MSSLHTYKIFANTIVAALQRSRAISLTLLPGDHEGGDSPDLEWSLLSTQFSGKEILYTAQTLEQAALVMALVSDAYPIPLRVNDGEGYTCSGGHLPTLIPGSKTKNAEALRNILPQTASNHGRLTLIESIRARHPAA